MSRLLAMLVVTILASTALAEDKPKASATQCQKKSGKRTLRRTIEIKPTDAGGCRVYLTRDEDAAVEVAHADHTPSVCPDKADKVIASLKGSGFTCD